MISGEIALKNYYCYYSCDQRGNVLEGGLCSQDQVTVQ